VGIPIDPMKHSVVAKRRHSLAQCVTGIIRDAFSILEMARYEPTGIGLRKLIHNSAPKKKWSDEEK